MKATAACPVESGAFRECQPRGALFELLSTQVETKASRSSSKEDSESNHGVNPTSRVTDRFDMIDLKVEHHGDIVVLTFNRLSHRTRSNGTDAIVARWNATPV